MFFFFFKQKTSYEMRISDWSSDVCSSDLNVGRQWWGPDPDEEEEDWSPPVRIEYPAQSDDGDEEEKKPEASPPNLPDLPPDEEEIGRESCRDRGCQYV